jgi:hypothetical protein
MEKPVITREEILEKPVITREEILARPVITREEILASFAIKTTTDRAKRFRNPQKCSTANCSNTGRESRGYGRTCRDCRSYASYANPNIRYSPGNILKCIQCGNKYKIDLHTAELIDDELKRNIVCGDCLKQPV